MKTKTFWDSLGFGPGWEEQKAVLYWKDIVGEKLASLARALYVDQGVLHLAVASPVVANELRLWKDELLRRLARYAPESHVKELRFHPVPAGEQPDKVMEPSATELNRAEDLIPEEVPSSVRPKLVHLAAWALLQEATILGQGGRRCSQCDVAFLGEGDLCPLCRLVR